MGTGIRHHSKHVGRRAQAGRGPSAIGRAELLGHAVSSSSSSSSRRHEMRLSKLSTKSTGAFNRVPKSEMRNFWERLQSAKRRAGRIGHPYNSYDEMMVWAREQQAEVEVETCSSGAQRRQPPPEGWDSGRDDGIARPGHGRPNQSRSEDRATGHDDEIVGRHEETLEERESAEAAAAPTMAPGTSSREGNRLVRGGEPYPTRA